ncbi:MAG: hypothetical protein GY861_19720 [bacterium]|nr:hypothetical protein [bacterium]
MRRDDEQRTKKRQIVLALFIAFIMISSTAGFIWSADATGFKYNGFSFQEITGEGIFAKVDGEQVRFDYRPETVEDIEMDPEAASKLRNTMMFYMTSNFSGKYAREIEGFKYDLIELMEKQFDSYIVSGFTTNASIEGQGLIMVSCDNATDAIPVLSFERADDSSIDYVDNCVKVKGNSVGEFRLLKDRLVYGILGIVE